jgi:hypothetical protein
MFKHCSTVKGAKGNRAVPFSFSWIKLTDTEGVILGPAKEKLSRERSNSERTNAASSSAGSSSSRNSSAPPGPQFDPNHQVAREDSYELPCYYPLESRFPETPGGTRDVSYLSHKPKRRVASKLFTNVVYESFHVQMNVTSTSKTTARDLEMLTHCKIRELKRWEIVELLNGITFVDPREQAKLMRKLFDTTCSLFGGDYKSDVEVHLKSFELLVHIVSNPSAKVKMVIQNYIESPFFDGRSVYSTLIECVKHYTKDLTEDGSTKLTSGKRQILNKIVASFTTIIRMIVVGRAQAVADATRLSGSDAKRLAGSETPKPMDADLLSKTLENNTRSFRVNADISSTSEAAVADGGGVREGVESTFLKSVEELVVNISKIMKFQSTEFLTIQGKVLHSFSGVIGDLSWVFPPGMYLSFFLSDRYFFLSFFLTSISFFLSDGISFSFLSDRYISFFLSF